MNLKNFHKRILFSILITSVICSNVVFAKRVHPSPYMTKAKNKLQKHFDINDDGYNDFYERHLIKTHLLMGYPLAKKKKMLPYDLNYNMMLENDEFRAYTRDLKSKSLKKFTKEQKIARKKRIKKYKENAVMQRNYVKYMNKLRDKQRQMYNKKK